MKRVSRNAAALLGSDLLRRLLGFLAVTYLARIIGTEGFGAVNLGFTVLSYAIVLSSAGLPSLGAREVARAPEQPIVGNIVGARIRNALIAFGVICAVLFAFVESSEIRLLILIFSSSVLTHAVLLEWYYQGREEMEPIGYSRTISAVVYLVILVAAVTTSADLLMVGIAAVAGDLAGAGMLGIRFFRSGGTFTRSLTVKEWLDLNRRSLPFGIGTILGQVSLNFPVIVLGIAAGTADVGLFSAANKMVFFLLMVDRLLGTVLLPATSRIHALRPDELAPVLSMARKWVMVLALPLCVGGTILAPRLLGAMFGEGFLPAGNIFGVLVWFVPLTLLHTVYTSGLLAQGREKEYSRVMMVSAGLYAMSTVIGVLMLGPLGAGVAMVLSELITLDLMRRQFNVVSRIPFDPALLTTAVSAVIMGIGVKIGGDMHLASVIPAGALLYVAFLFLTRAVTIREVRSLLERFK